MRGWWRVSGLIHGWIYPGIQPKTGIREKRELRVPGHTGKNLYPRIQVKNCIQVGISILAKTLSEQLWGMRNAGPSQGKPGLGPSHAGAQARPGPKRIRAQSHPSRIQSIRAENCIRADSVWVELFYAGTKFIRGRGSLPGSGYNTPGSNMCPTDSWAGSCFYLKMFEKDKVNADRKYIYIYIYIYNWGLPSLLTNCRYFM